MANRPFGKLADVWKHLVLAEVLSVDRPRQLCDTHAGHACYAMITDAERRYGVLGFMDAAIDHGVLNRSAYFRLLAGQRDSRNELSDYPAGPMLAMLELGAGSEYLYCDLDPESCANIRDVAARLGLDAMVRVVEGDGITAVREAVPGGHSAGRTLVYTDPFDHRAAPGGLSALGLAQEAAERGAGVVYWYGYNRADERRWVFDLLRTSAPTIGWWCGDVMVSAPDADMHDGDLGAATSPGTGPSASAAPTSPTTRSSAVATSPVRCVMHTKAEASSTAEQAASTFSPRPDRPRTPIQRRTRRA